MVGCQSEKVENRQVYQAVLRKGQLDQCGVTLLAGEAVGAPFVGSVVACLTVSEVLRLLHGGAQKRDLSAPNPGYFAAASAG